MSASRTIPSRSPTITPHIETVCANNTRICPTNSDKRASSPLYPGSMASNSISVSVNLNAAPDTAESNYLPLQNLCIWGVEFNDLSVSFTDSLFLGTIGHSFGEATRVIVREADAILAIGTPLFPELFPSREEYFSPGCSLMQIDFDPWEIAKNFPVHLGLQLAVCASVVQSRRDGRS